MNIHTLSYTRQVSRGITAREREFSYFKGSSLLRKKKTDDKKVHEASAPVFVETVDEVTGAPAHVDLLTGEVYQPTDRKPGTDKRFNGDDCQPGDYRIGERKKDSSRKRNDSKSHRLSPRSKNKIREKIFALYASHEATFTFLTLTFIAPVDDVAAQKCLNKFLTVLRKEFGRFVYLWVAERQEENKGRIHFHFITDRRFPVQRVNSLWVLQQYNSGITHEKYSKAEIVAIHKAGTMTKALNPLDIREVKNIDALSGYLTGYITKNDAEFQCSAWHCCRYVSGCFTGQVVAETVAKEVTNQAINCALTRGGKIYVAKTTTITNKDTGKTVAIVTNIVNKTYFKKHLNYLEELNRLLLTDYLDRKRVTQTFLMDRSQWFDAAYTSLNLN